VEGEVEEAGLGGWADDLHVGWFVVAGRPE